MRLDDDANHQSVGAAFLYGSFSSYCLTHIKEFHCLKPWYLRRACCYLRRDVVPQLDFHPREYGVSLTKEAAERVIV
jgi:hypothetical protein